MTCAATPRISVIIPIYNVAAHVRACIRSVAAQTLTGFEVLLVDDGSTDDSGAIALEATQGDPRFRLITQENAGLGAARNTGLAAATGACIAFVDSDDRLMPDYLMRLWQTLEETGGDWVACAVRSAAADGTGSTHSAIHGQADLSLHGGVRRYDFHSWSDVVVHFPSAWNKLYRRHLIEGLRFDEGIWFEDHGFFHRAAARTDHIIHLPEALYIQTRGRTGQITGQDSERVFEQFDVLDGIGRQFMAAGGHGGGPEAFARIATRLVFERSTIIADPDRRARFAATARDFLNARDLDYSTDWDTGIGLSWGLEMAGALPLSVILSWDGTDRPALTRSLEALRDQTAPGHEVLIVCQTPATTRALEAERPDFPPHWHIHTATHKNDEGAAFNHGLRLARGAYVVCVRTGDALTPWTLLHRTEAMMRADADFGITAMRLCHSHSDSDSDSNNRAEDAARRITSHNGMHDMALWPDGPPVAGPLAPDPAQALGLEAHCSAKIFRRSFLQARDLGFTAGPHPDWALCLNAALLAPVTLYLPDEGVRVMMRDLGFEQWHKPLGARALLRGHKALLAEVTRKLPAPLRATLPQGWQRRLFARALREQVYFADYTGRLARPLMVLGAAWGAWRHGYGTGGAAGLDPSVGPRLAQILDPVSLLRRKLGLGGAPPDTAALAKAPDTLHAFAPQGTGVVTLRADFSTTPYANLFFRAAPHGPALFHVSLRHAENLAVCNRQSAAGQWHREQHCSVDLSAGSAELTVTFTPPQVSVALNGQEIFHFKAAGLRRRAGFPQLETIVGFDVEGTLHARQIIPQMPDRALALDSRLILRTGAADSDATLRALPCGTVLPLIPAPGGTAMALLPARLWRDLPEDTALTLELEQGGTTRPLTLPREDVLARIETALTLPLAFTDSTLFLTLLEHVRYARLADRLSPPARRRLDAGATFFHVQDFLYAGQSTLPPPAVLPAAAPSAGEVAHAIARLAQSQTGDFAHRPDPLEIVAALHVPRGTEQLLFLTLAEYFCSQERDFDGLCRLAAERGILPFDPQSTRWGMSAALPYDMASCRYDAVRDTLRALAVPDGDWLVTAGVAWTVRRAVTDAQTPALARRGIFQAFCELLYKRAPDYWERVHCRELTRTAAALITSRHRLAPDLQREAITLCLRVYGLSRQFWADLAGVTDLPAELENARTAFGHLMSEQAEPQSRAGALRLFETAGAFDAPRLRREIFGPAGLPRLAASGAAPAPAPIDITDLDGMAHRHPATAGHALLRHMAAPGTAPVTPAVAGLASAALPLLYPQTRRAPYFTVQQKLTRQARALSAGAPLTGILDSLTQLADAGSQYLGLGMALALIDRLHDDAPDSAETLCDWMHGQLARLAAQDTHGGWRDAPALVQPLRRLTLRAQLLPAVHSLTTALGAQTPAALPADNAGLPPGNPLFDTLVTVFSCVPYLDTRIPAMRAGWLGLLEDLGVPYVVVIGDGDGTRRGDIVHLDAPDDYEGLPQKTLAAIRWVHDNTRFGHMLKIDDDCFLNAPLFFGALSYRKFDYYGRRLDRAVGQMDRKWHQGKSASLRGQLDLDKSPEPSGYADGGTAYALSRTAMAAALGAADSPQGRELVAVSFMEDKMLGDLLALRGILPADEDYRISMRRRTYGAATPVALWQNSFHASRTAEIQLVHLDTHVDQADALARLDSSGLWPRKIWPSYQEVRLGYQSNALELLSPEAHVARARDAQVAVVACMRNEMFMLPHFLAHYRKLGVGAFLIADNCSDDGTREYLAQQEDVALFSVDTDYRQSHYGVAWQQAMLSAFRVGKWSLVADADELLVWQDPQRQTLPDLLRGADFTHADAVRIFMLDMYPQGPLEQADFAGLTPFAQAGCADRVPFLTNTVSLGPYSNQPSWTSALRHRLIPGSAPSLFTAQKLALLRYRPWMRLSAGLHFVSDAQIAPRELLFAHFKYNADFRRKAQTEVLRGQHFNDAEEYRKYLALASEGRSILYDPELSAPWTDVPFVRHRLDRL